MRKEMYGQESPVRWEGCRLVRRTMNVDGAGLEGIVRYKEKRFTVRRAPTGQEGAVR